MDYRISEHGQGSILGLEEAEAVLRAFQQNTLSFGPLRDQFDQAFADYIGAGHALSVSSCTAGLFLATQLLRIGEGDEVICTPPSFRATVGPLWARKVVIRFADIDPNSLNIDPATIEDKITDRTKAIYLVHYGGQPADMDGVMAIARRHGLYVVEDCAHAPGAEYKGRKTGAHGDIASYSFHSLKNMSMGGEGGAMVINREELVEPALRMRSIGPYAVREDAEEGIGPYMPDPNLSDDHKGAWNQRMTALYEVGNNYRISEVQAAIGLVQLRKLDGFNDKRRELAHYLDERLAGVEGITVQQVPADVKHVYHLYTIFYDADVVGAPRSDFIKFLAVDRKIQIIQRFFPLHLMLEARYFGHRFGECPVTERTFFERQVNLPVNPRMTRQDCDYMIDAVKDAIATLKKT